MQTLLTREDFELAQLACSHFPETEYVDPRDVLHARREYMKCIKYLRQSEPSKWVKDQHVQRVQ